MSTVQIVATSDFHGELPEIPKCDLLLIGGDICPEIDVKSQAQWLDTVFRKWLEKVPAKEIVGIAGNHDAIFMKAPELLPKGLRWHYLEDSSIELLGLKIYGTPWQLPFFGVFTLSEKELEQQYRTVPKDVDIWLSHAPPFGIFDEVPVIESDGDLLKERLRKTGSHALLRKIQEIEPKLFVCGHIHCCFGICKIGETTFANVCFQNDPTGKNAPRMMQISSHRR